MGGIWQRKDFHLYPTNRDELACLYLNARSIVNKFDLFEAYVYDINPDIIELDWVSCVRYGIGSEWLSSVQTG